MKTEKPVEPAGIARVFSAPTPVVSTTPVSTEMLVPAYAPTPIPTSSGMMMAAQAYIEHGGTDDADAIKDALGGHVVRNGEYILHDLSVGSRPACALLG